MWVGRLKPDHMSIVNKMQWNSNLLRLLTGVYQGEPIHEYEERARGVNINNHIHNYLAPLLIKWDFYFIDLGKIKSKEENTNFSRRGYYMVYENLTDAEIVRMNLRLRALCVPPWSYYLEGNNDPIITSDNKEEALAIIEIRNQLAEIVQKQAPWFSMTKEGAQTDILEIIRQALLTLLKPANLMAVPELKDFILSVKIPEIMYNKVLPYTSYKITNDKEIKIGEYNGRV